MAKQIKKVTTEEKKALNKAVCKSLRKLAKAKVIDDKITRLTDRVRDTLR